MLVRREKPTKPRNRDQLSALTLFLQLFDQDFFEKMQISPKRLRFLKKIEDLKKIVLDYTYRARWPEGLLCFNNSMDCLKFKNLNCAKF